LKERYFRGAKGDYGALPIGNSKSVRGPPKTNNSETDWLDRHIQPHAHA